MLVFYSLNIGQVILTFLQILHFKNYPANQTGMNVSDFICVKDFEQLATKKLSKNVLDYFRSGATDEQTLEENCTAFKAWRFRPQVLRDVSHVDMQSSVLGHDIEFPICVAPTGMNQMASLNGEIDSARAAEYLNTGFALSTWATSSIEEIANTAPSLLKFFQLYVHFDRESTKQLVQRAQKNGFHAIIVTVDTAAPGRRYPDIRNKFALPENLRLKNFENIEKNFSPGVKNLRDSGLAEYGSAIIDPSLSWKDIDWLKTITNLPIIVKGILTAEMAIEAVEHKVDGIVVSNHGGRQLDGVVATINTLPQVVAAVKGRCEVYLDSGIRNGGDVAKAIALGAKAVFVGRPVLWGLACDGEQGARKVLEILRDDFELTMKLLGVTSIKELQSIPYLVFHESKIISKL